MPVHDEEIHAVLERNCTELLDQYQTNLELVLELQTVLIEDILPSLADELGLDSDATEWAKEWLNDTCKSPEYFFIVKLLLSCLLLQRLSFRC